MNKCNVIKDLLPLYADEICSEDSKEMVEEHLASCKDCTQELEAYRYNTGLPEVSADVAIKKFKKKMSKKNLIKIAVSVVICVAVLLGGYYVLFEEYYVVPYSEELLEVNIPVDGGFDVWFNLDNYAYVKMIDLYDEDDNLNIYLTALQTNFTKIFPDSDTTDHLWRANNDMGICYQGNVPHPISGDDSEIKNIYYLEMHPDDLRDMLDNINFNKYNPTLIWSAPETE